MGLDMIGLIATLAGSVWGRYLIAFICGSAILGVAAWRFWALGRSQIEAQIAIEGFRRLRNAIETSETIDRLSRNERRRYVERFLRAD
jgi:hypothetical protein